MATKVRNPPWNRDELTLALDLYVKTDGNPTGVIRYEEPQASSPMLAVARPCNFYASRVVHARLKKRKFSLLAVRMASGRMPFYNCPINQ